jgi:hypothetical protein
MTLAVVLGGMLAVLVVIAVARPFLREPAPASDLLDEPGELERRRLTLAEERDRRQVGPLRRRAAEALRALEPRAEARHAQVARPG